MSCNTRDELYKVVNKHGEAICYYESKEDAERFLSFFPDEKTWHIVEVVYDEK